MAFVARAPRSTAFGAPATPQEVGCAARILPSSPHCQGTPLLWASWCLVLHLLEHVLLLVVDYQIQAHQ